MALQQVRTKDSMKASATTSVTSNKSLKVPGTPQLQNLHALRNAKASKVINIEYIIKEKPKVSVLKKWLLKNVEGIEEDNNYLDLEH